MNARIFVVLSLVAVLGGCSVIDGLADASASRAFGSSKVFLGDSVVQTKRRRELDRYTCGSRPMLCQRLGSRWECHCPF